MKQIFLILTNFCLIFGLSSIVAAQQNKPIDKRDAEQLEVIYKELDAATKKLDLKTYEKYLDQTFTVEYRSGSKISRDDMLEIMKEFFANIAEVSEAVTKIEKMRLTGGNYFLETSTIFKGKLKKPNENNASVIEIRTKSTDVWIKTAKGWKEISQTERGAEILIDGSPPITN